MSLMILVGVVLPLMLGIRFRLHHAPALLADGPLAINHVIAWGAFAILPFLIASYFAVRATAPRLIYLVVIVVCAILLRAVYLVAIDDVFFSDYRTMWDFTQSVINGEHSRHAATIQEMRAVPFLLPVTSLAGGSDLGFKIGNLVYSVLTALAAYLCVRVLAGEKPAASRARFSDFFTRTHLLGFHSDTRYPRHSLYFCEHDVFHRGLLSMATRSFPCWRPCTGHDCWDIRGYCGCSAWDWPIPVCQLRTRCDAMVGEFI
ncbi:MAG: hypothetical protein MZV65_22500 [Chromatiales bacterium]|nr:hypothetical protein [Chromatiales bacterium]